MRTAFTIALLTLPAGGLEDGEVIVKAHKIEGSPVPEARVRALIDAPPEDVWPLIERCGDYEKTMVRTKEAKELSRRGDVVTCRVTIDMPFPLADITSTTRARHTVKDGRYRRAWKFVEGDYHENTGSWTLSPYAGGRTLVEYRVHAVPKVPVPAFLQEAAQQSSLPELIRHLRKQVAARQSQQKSARGP